MGIADVNLRLIRMIGVFTRPPDLPNPIGAHLLSGSYFSELQSECLVSFLFLVTSIVLPYITP